MTAKLTALTLVSCLFFSGGVFAEEANSEVADSGRKTKISYEEQIDKTSSSEKLYAKNECCPVAKSCCAEPCPPQCKDVTPSARGCHCRNGYFGFADFLYWTANEDSSTNYAFHLTDTVGQIGSVVNLDTGADPGFRIGVGGNFSYDGWDLAAAWTYYHNSSTNSVSVFTNGTTLGLLSVFLTDANPGIPTASATWKLNYNALNLDLGRAFYVSKGLSLRPFISSETVWMHRWFAVNYGLEDAGNLNIVNTPGKYRGRANFWGTGPRAGMDTKWYLGCTGLNLTSNLALSMLYGEFKTSAMCVQSPVNSLRVDYTNKYWSAIPHLQILFGLGWESCFCSDQYFLSFSAGWELNKFWDVNRFLNASPNVETLLATSSGIFMQGLTFRTKFDF